MPTKALLALSLASFAVPAVAAEVTGKALLTGYQCPEDSRTGLEHPVNQTKRDAVIAAESQCDWDGGRPTVTKTGEWTVKTSCVTLRSGTRYGQTEVSASFSCP